MLGTWMEREIGEQPDVLKRAAPDYESQLRSIFEGKSYDIVLLAARGSSDHAALYARYLIEIHLGIPVSLAAPSVLTRFNRKVRYTRALAVGISQSGSAPDVSEVLAMMRGEGHDTLAVTNSPDSRLTEAAEHTLLLGVGPEKSVAATKTYSASLLAMAELVRALGGDLPNPSNNLPGSEWLEQCQIAASELTGPLLRSNPTFALARGYSFCTAQETALKLMECALIACKAYSTADFEHGPKALAGPGSAAVVYGESADGLESQGCQILHAPESSAPDPLKPIWDICFGQYLALTCARSYGLDPDHPDHIRKVTETL